MRAQVVRVVELAEKVLLRGQLLVDGFQNDPRSRGSMGGQQHLGETPLAEGLLHLVLFRELQFLQRDLLHSVYPGLLFLVKFHLKRKTDSFYHLSSRSFSNSSNTPRTRARQSFDHRENFSHPVKNLRKRQPRRLRSLRTADQA